MVDQKITTGCRHDFIDIARGIGIFLVVYAHAGCINGGIINYFHMPLFFFLSGFTFNDHDSPINHIRKRLLRLYLPFVFLNLTIVLFNFPLYAMGLKSIQYGVYDYLHVATSTLAFNCSEFLVAQTWFLFALFCIDVLMKLSVFLLRESGLASNAHYIMLAIGLFFCFVGLFLSSQGVHFIYSNCDILGVVFISMIFFIAGYCLCSKGWHSFLLHANNYVWVVAGVVLLVLTRFAFKYQADFRSNEFSNFILCIPLAFIGIITVLHLSVIVSKTNIFNLRFVLIYLGVNTMPIFLLHPLCFKLIGLLQVFVFDFNKDNLADWGNVYVGWPWGVAYLLVGLIIPVYINSSFRMVKACLIPRARSLNVS